LIDTNATVTDGGSADFDGGTLTVTIATNGADEDLMLVEAGAEIGVEGSTVSFNGAAFGTFAGGEGTNALVFSFNTNATPAVVQALVRSLTFETDGTNTTSRVFQMVLADGDGGTSAPAFRTLELNRPPVAQEDCVLSTENTIASIPFSLALGNDFDVDGDSISLAGLSVVSANGGRITLSGNQFIYRPPTNFVGTDLFAYLIDDGRGGEGIGLITLKVLAKKRLMTDASELLTVGNRITMGAVPGHVYQIQVSDDLVTWTLLQTVTANANGVVEALDAEAKNRPKRFYRAIGQ
jgi:hypothetical protein